MSADQHLHVTAPGDREIVLSRTFDAPAGLVFDALTQPELLTRWYGARGWNLVSCTVDLRVGGRYRFVSRGPEDAELAQSGTYREIERPSRLVYTEVFDDQSYPGETLIAHDLAELAATTTLTSTLRYPSPEAREIVLRYPMTRGVGESYGRLDAVLTELTNRELANRQEKQP
ncbi:SRPBCC family protein [Promicromonospora panici]|uniref:SRPBCC family protein n=1 Tax=Promicromonospora panici TaxID=2219658 RepID=UPI001A90EEFC|nr:SRPBCC family protein [Promicromonospora panici]